MFPQHHKNPEKQLLEYYNELKATTSDPETKLNICYSIRGGVSRILCILRNKISSLDKAFDYRGLFADMVDSLVAEIRSKYTSLFDPDIKPAISFLEKFNDTTDIGKFLKLDIYKKLGSGEFIPVTDQGKLLIARMGAIATLAKDMPLRESAKDDENTADTDAEKAFADAAICTAHDISRLCRPWDENDRDEENSLQVRSFSSPCVCVFFFHLLTPKQQTGAYLRHPLQGCTLRFGWKAAAQGHLLGGCVLSRMGLCWIEA